MSRPVRVSRKTFGVLRLLSEPRAHITYAMRTRGGSTTLGQRLGVGGQHGARVISVDLPTPVAWVLCRLRLAEPR